MTTALHFDIRPQPDNTTCGPTCLHAVYRYFDDPIDLSRVIDEVPTLEGGGTLSVYLASHALRRGYRTTIIPYNLQIFDPTWSTVPPGDIAEKLRRQCAIKSGLPGFEQVTEAYLEYLRLGGRLTFEVLTVALIRKYLKRGIPVMTGLSATYLYNSAREYDLDGRVVYDDVRGESVGHFVVLAGYNRETRRAWVADPFLPNPLADGQHYCVDIDRLVCAIMLGILTNDGDLLIIQPKRK
ncbi:C39 family peptidase [uncultured Desulfosarcina sp.]|uniref:C39 family peptidase n=1 Tax=uncultured Desulfosarcina sp. TaxID=218289 RepID=UPI0029C7656D|nr:C39 family peptidase [uncultured Desulfosarcina sp.]